jgi:hypothetical protein
MRVEINELRERLSPYKGYGGGYDGKYRSSDSAEKQIYLGSSPQLKDLKY